MKDTEFINEIQGIIDFRKSQPERMNGYLNLKIKSVNTAENYAEYIFDVEDWALNPYGAVHGGACCAAFDTSMGISAVALTGHYVSTTDITVSYLKPMMNKQYIFRVEFTQVGKKMVRFMGKAIDAQTGALCATSIASFMVTDYMAKDIKI